MFLSENSRLEIIKADAQMIKGLLNFLFLLVQHFTCLTKAGHISLNSIIHIFIDLLYIVAQPCFQKVYEF